MWIQRCVPAFGSDKEHFRESFKHSHTEQWHLLMNRDSQAWQKHDTRLNRNNFLINLHPLKSHPTKIHQENTFMVWVLSNMLNSTPSIQTFLKSFQQNHQSNSNQTKSTNFALNGINIQLILAPGKEHSPQLATSTTDVTKQNQSKNWFHSIITVLTTVRFVFIRLNKTKFDKQPIKHVKAWTAGPQPGPAPA